MHKRKDHMTTKINRTPFRPIKDIPSALLALDIYWQTGFSDRACVLTSDGKHGHYLRDDGTMSSIHWMDMRDTYVVRPHSKTWAEVERLADEKEAAAKAKLPKDGDPITVANALSVVKEGCKQAIAEDRKEAGKTVGTYSASGTTFTFPCATVEITYRAAPTHKTYIVAVPKGRRKYVKLYLKQCGYRNVDVLPYSAATDASYDLGYVTKQMRDDLRALAPDILLTY